MALDRTRLVRVLGMLGSAHAGERANAAEIAVSIVREAGLTWDDMIFDPEQLLGLKAELDERAARIAHLEQIVSLLTVVKPKPVTHKDRARECLESGLDWLTRWEKDFLGSFVTGRYPLMTDRQLEILERIEEKLEDAGVT